MAAGAVTGKASTCYSFLWIAIVPDTSCSKQKDTQQRLHFICGCEVHDAALSKSAKYWCLVCSAWDACLHVSTSSFNLDPVALVSFC